MEEGAEVKPVVKKGKRSNQARFPLARIKKLIQTDEDVGKLAQGTPVVVSKAIELFLKELVDGCVKDAQDRGSKKITAYGLKRAINGTPILDFCADIVASVPDPLTEDNDEEGGKPKKKRAAPRKKKDTATESKSKVKDEDDEESDAKPIKGGSDDDYDEE